MNTMLAWIKTHRYLLLLYLIGVVLAFTNYTPGTYLSGWDTLHPEFNFPLAFQRMLFGVWRQDQGLGTIAIQSHMADLPRVFLLWLESLVLPQSLLRYSYVFLMLVAGPVGMFFLTNKILGKKTASPVAFLSGLTYLINLGTIQQFILPLEMFAVHYGLLPWILLTTWTALETWSKTSLILFAIVMIFASPQAHTATLFYAFILIWFTCLCIYVLIKGTTFKKILTLLGIALSINAFWLLPNIYAVVAHGNEVGQSKINRLFTPEAIAKNQEFGNFTNVPVLKSFLFDWQLFNTKTNQFEEVTLAWQKHLSNPMVQGFGYLVFAVSILGIIQTTRQRNKVCIAMLPLFIIPFLLLLNGTWPVSQLFELLGKISPVAAEALRFPFTKFSIPFMVALSFYAGQGLLLIMKQYKKISKGIAIAYTIVLLIYFFPAFQGNFIHPAMRVTIPQEYFDMFQWFQTQPVNERVTILPIHTFWGWTYYKWGYQGAGFLQFGIPQPIMDRDYNRWSKFNEQYQHDMSYAIYSQNPIVIADVLATYQIQWILLDRSVISPGNKESSLLTWRIPALLRQTGHVTLIKNFGSDLSVYQVAKRANIQSAPILPGVSPTERFVGQGETPPVATFSGRQFKSINDPTSDHMSLSDLRHDQAYVVAIKSRNTQGFPLELCINNDLSGHCDLFTHLERNPQFHTEQFLLPALSDYGTGYTINFNNFAIRGQTSINDVESVTVSKATLPQFSSQPVSQPAVVLNQSFDPGWIAWDGKQLLPHVLVNGWANAWTLPTNQPVNQLTIFFLPQLLQWIGFALLPLPFLAIILYDKRVWRK